MSSTRATIAVPGNGAGKPSAFRSLLAKVSIRRAAVMTIVLVELLAMVVVFHQTQIAYSRLHVAKDDLGWSVYQLDKEFQRLQIATLDGTSPDGIALRAQIFQSRLNVIQKDAIFEDTRAGKLGVKLDAFFSQVRPLVEEARNLGSTAEIKDFNARLSKVAPLMTMIAQEIDADIRREAVQDRSTFEQLLGRTLALLLLLAATLLALAFMQLWHARKLEATLNRLTEKDLGIFNIFSQIAEPLVLIAVPFNGPDSIRYRNAACETACGSKDALVQALSAIERAQGFNARPSSGAKPVSIKGRFIEVDSFDLGPLYIENFEKCMLLRLRDVTDQLTVETEKHALQSQLAEAEEWKFMGTAAASVVHELHQPLAAASNFLYVAADTIAAHENLDTLPYLIDRSKQMLFKIQQISSQMRSLVPVNKASWEIVPLRNLVMEAKNILAESESFSSRIKLGKDDKVACLGSPVQLTQVFLNLLRNALEASDRKEQGLTVKVDFRDEGGFAICDIADEAGGVPVDILERTLGSEKASKSGGMGLGLAISKHLAEVNGGTLSCRPNDRGGTTFSVHLPSATAPLTHLEDALEQA